jgi:Hypothetical protein (DUF2513)
MKRDMELVRKLLAYFDEKPDDRHVANVKIEGHRPMSIKYHLILLYEAGFIAGEPTVSTSSKRVIRVLPMRLTWEGHEFLAAARNDTIWRRTRAKISSVGGEVPSTVLKELLTQTIKGQLGSGGGEVSL